MTRKDFEMIAAAIRAARSEADTTAEDVGIQRVVNALIPGLSASNANFDENRFRKACEERG